MAKKTPSAKTGIKVSAISIIASVFLSGLKLATGILGHSSAMISDAVNSLSDIASYTVVMGGVAASDKRADSHHQYGHDKMESIVSIILALAIFLTGLSIGWNGILKVSNPQSIIIPSILPLIGAVFSITIKLFLWGYTSREGKKTGLNSLKALAADHLSDVFASCGTFIGVIGSRLGLPVSDPIASIIIALLIMRTAYGIFRASANVLLDISVDHETLKTLESAILANAQVKKIDLLRTRSVGARYYVEVEIRCCRNLPLHEAHAIAEEVHDRIEHDFPKVKHVMVHTNPCSGDEDYCEYCQSHY
jgi:cation diffusion facilitator family transporter